MAGSELKPDIEALLQELPEVDRMAMERVRARTEAALFGAAPPARIGRYEIIERIGGGGMGLVYSARDPQLQRNVALKILHPQRAGDSRAQQRMLVEARTLAKLNHVNVVKIHDVLLEDRQVIVVMELLAGETLERWQQREARSWKEVVDVYAQAGQGLAAAHGVDVVHRDFKPSNAIISADGRVCVVDFGLARAALAPSDDSGGEPSALQTGLTTTEDVLGTLAYASPEQLDGHAVTAASDQFSFCVSLHLALEGVLPFDGTTVADRIASIQRGVLIQNSRSQAPPWLRALIARGLSSDPEARHPGMSEVVAELRRARGWRRWRLPVLGVAVLSVGVAGTAALLPTRGEEVCDGDRALAETAWNLQLRSQISYGLDAIGTRYASEVRDHVLDTLDRYAIAWRETHRSACQAHRRGETSAPLLDKQMLCLAHDLDALRAAAAAVAKVDAKSLANAMNVAAEIPSARTCGDLEAMRAEVAPPEQPEVRAQVEFVRSKIGAAEAEARAGRTEEASASLSEARAMAVAIPYPPVQVEAALSDGRVRLAHRDLKGARAALVVARGAAFENQMMSAALESAARIIYIDGQQAPQPERLERELEYLLPMASGLRGDHFTKPLLLNNIGTVYLASGRRDLAGKYFEDAKDEIRRHDPDNRELTVVDLNLAMVTSDGPKRETLARGVWDRLRDTLGARHPSTLDAMLTYALHVDDPALAFEVLSRTADAYETYHPESLVMIAYTASKRAFVASELGDAARTTALYQAALAKLTPKNDDVARWRRLCEGEVELARSSPRKAVEPLRAALDSLRSNKWWERADALRAEVGLGQAEAALGDDEAAMTHLADAVAGYAGILAISEEVEYRRCLARARRSLATLLRRRDPLRAATLEAEAAAFYRSAGPESYRWLSNPR